LKDVRFSEGLVRVLHPLVWSIQFQQYSNSR